ncbi:MAG: DUF5696 domain-containing protein [bacterium]|nr:DUF5696 domain-containing protein [bacterium]
MTIATRLRAGAVLGAWACGWACAAQTATMTVETVTADGRTVRETRPLEIRDGRARFVWPRAAIPPGAKSVALKPDFATAQTGEAGYWVFPNNTLGRFHETDGRVREGWHVWMPMYGLKTPRATFCAVATGMPHSLSLVAEAKKGAYCVYALFDRFMEDVYEDIAVEYTFLTGDDADYSGIARCYRAYQLGRGACRPIAARVRDQPLLAYAARHPEVRIRQAWKPVPSPVPDQVTRNEPPVRPVVTFDRVKEIVDECRRQGVDGAEFCLVGWNVGGHDGRFPQIFPVEPSLGGEAKLKDCVRHAQEKGYQIVGHSSFRDCYMIADTWDSEYVVEKNPDGTLRKGTTSWGGGRLYTMCPQRAYERFCPKQCAEMATLGFRGLFYVDVTTSRGLFPCPDGRHRLNNGQRAVWEAHILDELRATFGGSASEGAFDFCIGSVDSALTVQWVKPFEPPRNRMVDEYVPLWQLVYHGIVLSTPFRTMINCTANPDRRSLLKLAEFGGRPTYYWHSQFVTGRPPSMGTIDLEATTDEKMRQGVAWIKAGCDEYARRSALQFQFMERHETVAPGVVRVTYADGSRLLANYGAQAVSVEGHAVPPLDYVVVPGRAEAKETP